MHPGSRGLLHCGIQILEHAEHVHVRNREEGERKNQSQARQAVDVPLLTEQLSGNNSVASKQSDRGRCHSEGRGNDRDQADEVQDLLAGDLHASLNVSEEETNKSSDKTDDQAQDIVFRAIVRLVFEETKEVRTFIPSPENARAKIVTRGNSTSSTNTAEMIATIATVTGSRRTFVRFFFPEARLAPAGFVPLGCVVAQLSPLTLDYPDLSKVPA